MRRPFTDIRWALILALGMLALPCQARAQTKDEAPSAPQRSAAAISLSGTFDPAASPTTEYKRSVRRGVIIAGSIYASLSLASLAVGTVFTGIGCEHGLYYDPGCVVGNAMLGTSAIVGIASVALFSMGIGVHIGQRAPRSPALPVNPKQPLSTPQTTSKLELRSSSNGQLWVAISY